MKIRAVVCLVLLSPAMVFATECNKSADYLGAIYSLTAEGAAQPGRERRKVLVWRKPQQVAREYPEAGVTEVWALTEGNRLYVSRYFDQYHRGIEYQPDEVASSDVNADWQRQRELMSREHLESLELLRSSGKGCDREEVFHGTDHRVVETVRWLPELQLAREWRLQEEDGTTLRWQLEDIVTDTRKIDAAFALREQYQMTDYADIGDNESDPFLLRMINLGFVSHGASGFYNQQGQAMGGHHH
jgi:hypothetical protein